MRINGPWTAEFLLSVSCPPGLGLETCSAKLFIVGGCLDSELVHFLHWAISPALRNRMFVVRNFHICVKEWNSLNKCRSATVNFAFFGQHMFLWTTGQEVAKALSSCMSLHFYSAHISLFPLVFVLLSLPRHHATTFLVPQGMLCLNYSL